MSQVEEQTETNASAQEEPTKAPLVVDPPGYNITAQEELAAGMAHSVSSGRKDPFSSSSVRERKRFLEQEVARKRRFRIQKGMQLGGPLDESLSSSVYSSWVPYQRHNNTKERLTQKVRNCPAPTKSWIPHPMEDHFSEAASDEWVPSEFYRKDLRSPPAIYPNHSSRSSKSSTEANKSMHVTESNSLSGSSKMMIATKRSGSTIQQPQRSSELETIESVSEKDSKDGVLLAVDFQKQSAMSQLSSEYEEISISSSQLPSTSGSTTIVEEYTEISLDSTDIVFEEEVVSESEGADAYRSNPSSVMEDYSEYTEEVEIDEHGSAIMDPNVGSIESATMASFVSTSAEAQERVLRGTLSDADTRRSYHGSSSSKNSSSTSKASSSSSSSTSSPQVYIVSTNDCLDIRCYERRSDGTRGTKCKPTWGFYTIVILSILLVMVWAGITTGLVRLREER